jgi:hypothetical protein
MYYCHNLGTMTVVYGWEKQTKRLKRVDQLAVMTVFGPQDVFLGCIIRIQMIAITAIKTI